MSEIPSQNTPTIEELYNIKFRNIEDAKAFLEEHNIPIIWPSDRSDGHIMTHANGEAKIVNGREIPPIGKLTENDRGGIRLTGLARLKIAHGDPNLSVQDAIDRDLTSEPEKTPNALAGYFRGKFQKSLQRKAA